MQIIGLAMEGVGAAATGDSVDRPQDLPDLRVPQHVLPQQVLMRGVLPGDVTQRERQIAVCVQTRRDPQRVA